MRNLDKWHDAMVRSLRQVTPTVREITIDCPAISGSAPGSHVNIRVFIDDRVDHRSYSVVDHPEDGVVRIAVKHLPEGRGGSSYMWTLQPSARLRMTPPSSDFDLSFTAGEYVLLAGGIGITPLIRMAEALVSRGKPVKLFYVARSRKEAAYADRLRELLHGALHIHVSRDQGAIDVPGIVSTIAPDGELYMCGPLGLMEAVKASWAEQGRDRSRLHYETFGSSGRYPTKAFMVKVPQLGLEIEVPKDKSLLDALNDAGVGVLSDCRRGECGLCALEIVSQEGRIDHRDVFFSPEQHDHGQFICACVSRMAEGVVVVNTAYEGDPILRA